MGKVLFDAHELQINSSMCGKMNCGERNDYRDSDSIFNNYTINRGNAEDHNLGYSGDPQVFTDIQKVLYIYTLPVLISLGILGNILTFDIIRVTPLRKISVCMYMGAYAIFNTLSLSLNSGIDFLYISILGQHHFMKESDTVCRVWQFFIRIVTYTGVWFVIAMAIDRYIIVWHQHKRKQMCTPFIAKLTIAMILAGMVCLSVHAMWTYELHEGGCYILPNDIHRKLWPWVSGMIYSLIPSILIFVIGNLICFRIRCNTNKDEKLSMDLTYTTVVICCLYFILCSPATVITIMDNTLTKAWRQSHAKFMEVLGVCRDISQCLLWINCTALLPVLCLCCKVFRERFIRRLHCCGRQTMSVECTAV